MQPGFGDFCEVRGGEIEQYRLTSQIGAPEKIRTPAPLSGDFLFNIDLLSTLFS